MTEKGANVDIRIKKQPNLGHGKNRSSVFPLHFPLIKKSSPTYFRCLDEGESVLCNAIHSVNLNFEFRPKLMSNFSFIPSVVHRGLKSCFVTDSRARNVSLSLCSDAY